MTIFSKIVLSASALLLGVGELSAQVRSEVATQSGEKWWGIGAELALDMPFSKPFGAIDLTAGEGGAQASMLLISNYGRYIVSEDARSVSFDGSKFIFDGASKVEVKKNAKNLRAALVVALSSTLKPSGERPNDELITGPIYRVQGSDIEQSNIEGISIRALAYGLNTGTVSIGEGWQSYNGALEFSPSLFSDPKEMIESLHRKGFKVIVDVNPFISADSPTFRELEAKGALLGGSEPMLVRWEAGYSAVLDLNSGVTRAWLKAELEDLKQRYRIDGFNFTRGNMSYYPEDIAQLQQSGWYSMTGEFEMSMVGVGLNAVAGEPMQRITTLSSTWAGLEEYIPTVIAMGLSGYPYFTSPVYDPEGHSFSSDLYLRWLQVSIFMPSVEIAKMPWSALSSAEQKSAKSLIEIRAKVAPYIIEVMEESKKSGEPIIRSMEYNFPKKGFSDCIDQFMVGTDFIVAPIIDKSDRRIVRLPQGLWISESGEQFRGPVVMEIVEPINKVAYFTRKNR